MTGNVFDLTTLEIALPEVSKNTHRQRFKIKPIHQLTVTLRVLGQQDYTQEKRPQFPS